MGKIGWCLLLASAFALLNAAEFEAESGNSPSGGAAVAERKDASGGKIVRMRGKTNAKNRPALDTPADWVVEFPSDKASGMNIELKAYSPDTNSDSIFWSLNGSPIKEAHFGIHPEGTVYRFGVLPFKKGVNTMKFWTREVRLELDKFTLTEKVLPRPSKTVDIKTVSVNDARVERDADGIRLKPGVQAEPGEIGKTGDVEFTVTLPPGRYWLHTISTISDAGFQKIKKVNKFGSPRTDVAVGDQLKKQLCIMVAWGNRKGYNARLGKFTFTGEPQKVKFFLPPEVTLKNIIITPYTPPRVPAQVLKWKPTVLPPADRPRLLVTSDILPTIRKNLTVGENAPIWERIQRSAARKITVKIPPAGYDYKIELAIIEKAFTALMKQDKQLAREAIEAVDQYLQGVNFGNMLDITREIGRAIYTASYVYDWCYDEMKPEERDRIRANMMRLADDMECGWPPYLQSIVNGHGNENQMTRDLFSMAVAIYNEDPIPYRIIAYRMINELSPVHTYEYAAGRHNQGTSYGLSRFACDMMGAWNAKRTWKYKLFGDTIARVPYMWLYTRLPNGEMMRDGDDFIAYQQRVHYWGNLGTFFYCYTYNDDPYLKGETLRMGNPGHMGYLFLLFNDPNMKAEPDRSSLPLTYMAKDPYPAMVARTGWDFGDQANDAIVYLTGGGLNSYNHQHLNAGDFQIWYRGIVAADLGSYFYYGTPYDMNFNKQSISHNVMLVRDPNDPKDNGGQVYKSRSPDRLEDMEKTRHGRTLGAGFGPDKKLPLYSYLKSELVQAYPTGKLSAYERTVFVLNNGEAEAPMTVIVADRIAASAKYKKYWQINSFTPAKPVDDAFEILSLNGEGKLTLHTLYPKVSHEILSGKASHSVFGKQYEAPREELAEAKGSRLMLSPVNAAEEDRFLNVMQLARSGHAVAKPAAAKIPGGAEVISVGKWRVVRDPAGGKLTGATLDVPAGTDVLVSDLKPGKYEVTGLGGREVDANGLFFFRAHRAGKYTVKPVSTIAKPIDDSQSLAPYVKPTKINWK